MTHHCQGNTGIGQTIRDTVQNATKANANAAELDIYASETKTVRFSMIKQDYKEAHSKMELRYKDVKGSDCESQMQDQHLDIIPRKWHCQESLQPARLKLWNTLL